MLLALPVAVPDFVIAWGWVSLFPSLQGLAGASLVLTLGLYPLVSPPGGGEPAQRRPGPGRSGQEPRPWPPGAPSGR